MSTPDQRFRIAAADDMLARVGLGDERAFAALYDRGASLVHGLVRSILHDPALAEEFTGHVWVQVWHRAGGYAPEQGSAMAWILSLAHRLSAERVRTDPERVSGPRPAPAATPFQAVLLVYYRGLTLTQVGSALGVSRPEAAALIHAGLLNLRARPGLVGPNAATAHRTVLAPRTRAAHTPAPDPPVARAEEAGSGV
ncbi:hypothetical protein NE857_22825 [Nocardiopsis exhalans]|uniref:RNA polymerase sigma-70 region 2 domain-containing protein n=1 Tax=Nocardiopsis exhalans TaxID=163604 RepID=A0ABY5D4K5_9ACTN|nr:sigma factor [Nocardiopsis exhalans]USY18144.1 hypothetical protein NE857_22825 [Nocardiopsis exhalans]